MAKLFHAAVNGNEQKILKLLDNGEDVNQQCSLGETALWYAVEMGHAKIVRLLLNRGAIIHDDALHSAVIRGRMEIVEILIEQGVCIDNRSLASAIIAANSRMVGLLIAGGADLNHRDERERNPLCAALCAWHKFNPAKEEVVLMLLKNGININEKQGKLSGYNTVLHYAVMHSIESVKLLLNHGANINATNANGETPLELAICNHSIMKLLISRGAVASHCDMFDIVKEIQNQLARNINFAKMNIEGLLMLGRK